MFYLMEPLDTFFFRGSVPFEAGGETVAVESMYPPLPSVYAGAMKTMLKSSGRLEIGWNGLFYGEEGLYPLPADLSWDREENHDQGGGIVKPFKLNQRPCSNFPLDYCLYQADSEQKKNKQNRTLYLREKNLNEYLNAEGDEYPCLDLNAGYLTKERKIGIQIDPESGKTKEHQFYQITKIRPAKEIPLKLITEVNFRLPNLESLGEIQKGAELEPALSLDKQEPELNVITLGGEGKLATVHKLEYQQKLEVRNANSRYFKLYLSTPAIFEKGWLPGWLDETRKEGIFTFRSRQVRVKLLAACVGRSIPCGGYGYEKVKVSDPSGQEKEREKRQYHPKEQRFAVPAGSVYYFELLQGSFEDAVKLFHQKCISDYRESFGFCYPAYNKYRYCDRGFGYALVGQWRKDQEEQVNGKK